MKLNLSPAVVQILQKLEDAGHEAYLIGGSVRDFLLHKDCHDTDITTSATPEQVEAIFCDDYPVFSGPGKAFGTIGVVMAEDRICEITTFRSESGYSDRRHPSEIRFGTTLAEDVRRRDFTVNAMGYSLAKGLVDCVDGMDDLRNRVLRTVGDPEARFQEDPLRILRGVRFCGQLQLKPEQMTLAAMEKHAPLLREISRERIGAELNGILMCNDVTKTLLAYGNILAHAVPEAAILLGFDQKNQHHCYDLWEHTARAVGYTQPDACLRWAAFLHDFGKPHCQTFDENGVAHYYGHAKKSAELAKEIINAFAFGKAFRERVCRLVAHHDGVLEATPKALRRKVAKLGLEDTKNLILLQKSDHLAQAKHYRRRAIADHAKLTLLRQLDMEQHPLAVNGHDMMTLGLTGPAIRKALHVAQAATEDGTIHNDKLEILAYLREKLCLKSQT